MNFQFMIPIIGGKCKGRFEIYLNTKQQKIIKNCINISNKYKLFLQIVPKPFINHGRCIPDFF